MVEAAEAGVPFGPLALGVIQVVMVALLRVLPPESTQFQSLVLLAEAMTKARNREGPATRASPKHAATRERRATVTVRPLLR